MHSVVNFFTPMRNVDMISLFYCITKNRIILSLFYFFIFCFLLNKSVLPMYTPPLPLHIQTNLWALILGSLGSVLMGGCARLGWGCRVVGHGAVVWCAWRWDLLSLVVPIVILVGDSSSPRAAY